jgi:O-antigen ligase
VNKAASWLLFAAVAGAPLPFSSTDPATIAFWCMVLGASLILASPRGLDRRHFALIGLAAVVVAAYAVVLHEQLAAQPWFALATPHPLWAETSALLGVPLAPSVSIARNQPFYALGAPLAAMLSLLCGLVLGADRGRARELLYVIAWSGAVYAAYGILAHLFDPGSILWREKEAYLSVLTATFINRNAAAVYFGSCAVVWLLILCERIRDRLPRGPIAWRKLPSWLLSDTKRDVLLAFSMLFLCLAAMFMTGSRAGVVLSLMGLVLAFTLYFRRDLPARSGIVAALAAGGAVALILLQIMGAGVSGRFDIQGLADEGRLATWRATLRMIADHPWFGTGQGTFVWSYPAYRSPDISMWGVWDRAHDTLLEIAADLGLPLAGLVVVAWMVALGVLVHGVRNRRRDLGVPIAALSVAAIAVLHSLVDFSLQIPGYAIVAFALVGTGLAQSFGNGPGTRPRTEVPESASAAEVTRPARDPTAGRRVQERPLDG